MPPPIVLSDAAPVPPAVYVGTLKSLDSPIAVPLPSSTVTVHEIASFTRTYVVDALVCPTHASTDAVVADDTLNENALPPDINCPVELSFSVTSNVLLVLDGA